MANIHIERKAGYESVNFPPSPSNKNNSNVTKAENAKYLSYLLSPSLVVNAWRQQQQRKSDLRAPVTWCARWLLRFGFVSSCAAEETPLTWPSFRSHLRLPRGCPGSSPGGWPCTRPSEQLRPGSDVSPRSVFCERMRLLVLVTLFGVLLDAGRFKCARCLEFGDARVRLKQRCAGLASFTSTCVRNRGSPAMLKEISYLMRLMRPNAHPFHLTTHCIQVPRSWCLAWRLCVKSAIQICAVHKYSLFLSLYTFKITWGIEVRDNK